MTKLFFIVALNIADALVSPITNKTHSAAGNYRTHDINVTHSRS